MNGIGRLRFYEQADEIRPHRQFHAGVIAGVDRRDGSDGWLYDVGVGRVRVCSLDVKLKGARRTVEGNLDRQIGLRAFRPGRACDGTGQRGSVGSQRFSVEQNDAVAGIRRDGGTDRTVCRHSLFLCGLKVLLPESWKWNQNCGAMREALGVGLALVSVAAILAAEIVRRHPW